MARYRPLTTAIAGGLVAGVIDIGAAALINRLDPVIILRAIASGVLGKPAFSGGLPSALLGLVLQCLMSIVIALLYLGTVSRLPVLRRRWVLGGLAAGTVIFLVMTYAVVPLSRAWPPPHFTPLTFALNLAAMLLFGLIVAGFTRRR
ncbi:MAG TPA: hypothetical protein VGV37_05545 [Aliidongia sp.]|uniref:hypothetical protein n=1 Tax=Aliidongia sp. TaxID=1914230 RepID=UPI002DDCA757|nr:hypothetical protein [Aliidongia sp.]HEV2673986.1 hypothetical protein [Aliidongia sp.]